MKKILAFVLVLVMLCPAFSVSAESAQTWGVDNLNDKPGDLVIGFIGGSVTEGNGASPMTTNRWSSLVVRDYFKKNYPEKNVIERNAGIGGTTSYSGHTRILGDLQCGGEQSPDVVFIEFSINDAGNTASTSAQNMESMVRQLLRLPKVPAIVFVYLTKTNSDKTDRNSGLPSIIEAHKKVAENYGILGIDIDKHVWDGIEEGKWLWASDPNSKLEHMSNDTAHPTNFGHRVYADYIMEQLDANKAQAFKKLDKATPACTNYVYGELQEVPLSDERVTMSSGWEFVPAEEPNWEKSGDWIDKFAPDGYYRAEHGVGETVEFEFEGRGIGAQIVRTQHNAKFKWELYDENGNFIKTSTKSVYYYSDSSRVQGSMVFTNLPVAKYKVKVTGVLNQDAIDDHNANSSRGGSGERMPFVCFVVEKAMPEIHPVAKEVKFEEAAVIGATLNGSYKFECNTYKESKEDTLKAWYVSDEIDGTYTKYADGESLVVKPEILGKYVKYGVTPVNDSVYATAGKLSYSEPALVTRVPETVSSTPATIKVDGAASDELKVGTNAVSVDVTNEGEVDCTVYLTIALNETTGGVSKTNAVKVVPKLIPAGKTETISGELVISADDTYTDAMVLVIASDSLEPAKVISGATRRIDYMGNDTDGASVYKVSKIR